MAPDGYTAHTVFLRPQEVAFLEWVTAIEQRDRHSDWSFADTIELVIRQAKNLDQDYKTQRSPHATSGRAADFNPAAGRFG